MMERKIKLNYSHPSSFPPFSFPSWTIFLPHFSVKSGVMATPEDQARRPPPVGSPPGVNAAHSDGEVPGGLGQASDCNMLDKAAASAYPRPGEHACARSQPDRRRALSSCSSTSGSCRMGFPARSVKTVLPCVPLRIARSHSAAAQRISSRPA